VLNKLYFKRGWFFKLVESETSKIQRCACFFSDFSTSP